MNIMTYVSPVAHAPERWYAVSLLQGTLSRDSFIAAKGGVLQILSEKHAGVVLTLGKQSGRDVNKLASLSEAGYGMTVVNERWPVLSEAIGCMEVEALSFHSCGDHDVALCRMLWYKEIGGPDLKVLTSGDLRALGILPPAAPSAAKP